MVYRNGPVKFPCQCKLCQPNLQLGTLFWFLYSPIVDLSVFGKDSRSRALRFVPASEVLFM